jgi:hypothetical protein
MECQAVGAGPSDSGGFKLVTHLADEQNHRLWSGQPNWSTRASSPVPRALSAWLTRVLCGHGRTIWVLSI